MLVDSSVWIDFLNARETSQTSFLKRSLTRRPILTADLVLVEVLQGTRDARAFEIAQRLLAGVDVLAVAGREVAIEAAQHYQALRARGITIRRTIDTLIATRCIRDRIPLLYSDRDFDPFVQHLGLRSALDIDLGVQ